jgi:hypothetical protein
MILSMICGHTCACVVSSDQYAEVLQANPGLAGILDDTKLFRSERLAYRAY